MVYSQVFGSGVMLFTVRSMAPGSSVTTVDCATPDKSAVAIARAIVIRSNDLIIFLLICLCGTLRPDS